MSSKKDKLIAEARRFALRGQLDKAVKAYEQVVALDPTAINQRQRLAELLVKAGRIDNARSEFEEIGKFYAVNGYYLKAIAVYKKLQVMFPDAIEVSLKLAELNEKHGLAANALAEYKQVYDYYEQSGNAVDALGILEKMHAVDQQNVGIKLKLAEAYCQAGNRDGSYELFTRLAALLQERGDAAGVTKLNARIQQLFPEKNDFMLEVLAGQVRSDAASTLVAVGALQTMLKNNPGDLRIWELVIEAYQRLQQPERVKVAYQHCIRFFPNEVSVQKGVLESLISEKGGAEAIALLDQYEANFVDKGAFGELRDVYRGLERIDPINMRVLQGLKRTLEALGDDEGASSVMHKIESLQTFTEKHAVDQGTLSLDGEGEEPFLSDQEIAEEELETAFDEPVVPESEVAQEEPPAFDFSAEKEIEIEIEIEGDEDPFGAFQHAEPAAGGEDGAWLKAVDDVFDSAAASERIVKFGSELDVSDAQSHYDLGVAFKEMGLYDEALNELRQAADDPLYRVACLILQGTCLREQGDLDAAETVLRGLLTSELSAEDSCSVKYELALTCEAGGKSEEAAALLAEIDAAQPGFRDVRSRMDSAGSELSLDFSDEDLQGFDL